MAAKSRVAPLKQPTITRLELQTAMLHASERPSKKNPDLICVRGSRVLHRQHDRVGMVRSQARSFKTFVSTRTGEIQSKSDPAECKHIH